MSNFTKKFVAIATALTLSVGLIAPAQGATVEELQALIASLTAQIANLTAQLGALQGGGTTGGTIAGCTITSFDRNLSQGMSGEDVKCLQIILNSEATSKIADSGAGSPGNETTYFGPLTKAAAVKFQEAHASAILTPVGLTSGTGYVGPSTRAYLDPMLSSGGSSGGGTVTPGTDSVGLAADTPAASVVAQGATNVEFTKLTFSAGASAYTVNTIIVTRGGISVNADVTNLKLYDGATQVGSTQALNSLTSKATFNNLNLTIPANSTKTIIIKGTVGSGTGDSVVLGIASASDITATVVLGGTFPINGNAKTIAGSASAVGTLTAAFAATPATGNILSGSTNQQVATLQLTAATEGFTVNSIKLTNIGTAGSGDISNITLKYGATVLATVSNMMANNTVTLSGSPIISLAAGQTKNIDIYVDTNSGINTSRSVDMEVTQAADIVAVGTNSGGQVVVSGTFPMSGQTQTINQGTLTVTYDATLRPSAQTYVIGTQGRVFNALKFSAGSLEGVRLTQVSLTLGGTITATDISNISLYDETGTTLLATGNLSGTTVQFGVNTVNSFDASGIVDIPASTNKTLLVKVDISSGATAAATGTLGITAATQVKADGLLSMMDVPAASITGTAAGNLMTIGQYGDLTVSKDSTSPAAQTISKGSTNMVLARYALTAGAGEDILVSAMTIRLWKDGAGDSTSTVSGDVTNVSLWDGSNQLGSTVANPVASAAFNTNLVVPAGTTKVITVQATIPTGSTASSLHADLEAGTAADMLSTGVSSNASITESGDALGSLMSFSDPSLAVVASANPVASQKVTYSIGVPMTTLLLTAGSAEDVTVNRVQVSFAATDTLGAASAANSNFQNVKLMDGATQVGTTKQITDGTPDYVLFDGLSLTIAAGQTKSLTVVVDIKGTTAGPWYAGINAAGDITGAGAVSGTAVSSTGADQSGAALTIRSAGTLAVSVDADTPAAANVAVGVTQGAEGVSYSKIKLTAAYENVKVSTLILTRGGGGADANFGAIYLYDGTTKIGTSYLSSGTVTFTYTPGNEIIVPANGTKVITVKADVYGIGAGSTHGATSSFYLATTTTDIVSAGVSSQTAIAETVGSPDPTTASNFNAMATYKTTATVALVGPTGGAGTAAANQEVLRVSVTNNGAYDLTIDSFDVTPYFSGTTSASASTSLYNLSYSSATAIAQGATVVTSGTKITISPTSNNIVPAGATRTFVVKADTTGTITSGQTRSFHMDLAAIADFGWNPDSGGEVTTLTPGLPITGPTFTY